LSCECGTLKELISPVMSLTIWTRLKEPCIPASRRMRWRKRKKKNEKEKEKKI